ncbi:MAG: undecaprenyl-phosphate glucose phosphotransferase [Bacteroidaceae bacterium]|nr:undecaprenyl-phosphate glucose phosphotransferase [Bacteroidaceae bacterium]
MTTKGRYGKYLRSLIVLGDFLCINFAYILACLVFNFDEYFYNHLIWAIINVAYIPVSAFYSQIHNQRIVYANHVVITALQSTLFHAIIFVALLFFINDFDRVTTAHIFVLYAFMIVLMPFWWIAARKALKAYRSKGYNFKKVIIVGYGRSGKMLEKALLSDAGYGYKIVGIFDDNKNYRSNPLYRGVIADVEEFALLKNVDEIYCALPTPEEGKIMPLIRFAEKNAIHFFVIPGITPYLHRRLHFDNIGDVPVMSIRKEPLENLSNKFIKRAFDILFSAVALLFSPIIFVPVAIAIKCTSPGPVFFRQKRTGIKGKDFYCYKFRTMRVNNDSDSLQATQDDPRKTKLGEFLRRTSIDELPQFWNVLKGDMSVVGPRPHMIKHTEDYSKLIESYMLRHLVKPGITGWAQVNGYRGETKELWQMEKRVEYDVWYIENWDFFLDMKIIYMTIFNALRGEKNAY